MRIETEPARQRVALSWDAIQQDCARLAALLTAKGRWRGIVAVARGGLAPASLLSRALDTRLVETVSITSYDGEVLGTPVLLKGPGAAGDGEGWLVVDDLVDTGTTMRIVRGILPRAHVAVLYAKPQGEALADTIVRSYPQECWIDFPWEMAITP
jgi:xanthine phosphoribosyltransferase